MIYMESVQNQFNAVVNLMRNSNDINNMPTGSHNSLKLDGIYHSNALNSPLPCSALLFPIPTLLCSALTLPYQPYLALSFPSLP
jgi:hypothetical protein